jgi:hypothetical protein
MRKHNPISEEDAEIIISDLQRSMTIIAGTIQLIRKRSKRCPAPKKGELLNEGNNHQTT